MNQQIASLAALLVLGSLYVARSLLEPADEAAGRPNEAHAVTTGHPLAAQPPLAAPIDELGAISALLFRGAIPGSSSIADLRRPPIDESEADVDRRDDERRGNPKSKTRGGSQ